MDERARRIVDQAIASFPRGGLLPDQNWRRRHLALTAVLLCHVPILIGYGIVQGYSLRNSLLGALLPMAFGTAALWIRLSRAWRSISVAIGLISCSVVLVHLSHGLIEMHFHFFVIVALLTLYQDWTPFLIAIALTVLEHGVTGVLAPHAVYNHADAWAHPWKWALIHGSFIAVASMAGVTSWSMSEADHRRMKLDTALLHAQREATLVHAAHHDQLTGLPNRRRVIEHLHAATARSRANTTMLGVLFIDLDGFKPINDTYGHVVGDAVLMATADRLRAAVRGSDLAARLGGDEFVIVYEGLHNCDALETATARIEAMLGEAIVLGNELVLTVGASIGHVLATGDDEPEDLIERADLDMYRVKRMRQGDIKFGKRRVPRPR
jgi:diguanylate cyclase (GGDEF)-like protein